MKSSRLTSQRLQLCLCLLFSYALVISCIVPLAVRSAQAATARKTHALLKDQSHLDSVDRANFRTQLSFAQSGNHAQSRDGEVLVRFRATASEHDKNVVAASHGAQRKKLRGQSGAEKLTQAGQSPESLTLTLLQDPAVELAEPNFLIKPDQLGSAGDPTPNDAQFGDQWALRNTGQNGGQYGSDIGAAAAWQTTTGLPTTIIAVIDSGVDFNHPDLAINQWTNPAPSSAGDLHGWDYTSDNGTIKDEQGHGTAIAGIIAAQGNNATGISGVMWRATVRSFTVLPGTTAPGEYMALVAICRAAPAVIL
jgi:subtilisin family serine protease